MQSAIQHSVLVADGAPALAAAVSRDLLRAGYATSIARDAAHALELVDRMRPDLVVLSLDVPGTGGLDVLRRLRAARGASPAVILLTARGAEADRISGLRLGADDCVITPLSADELIARIDAVLRRRSVLPEVEPVLC